MITYADMYPALPNGHNVISLTINGTPVDFNDATKYLQRLDRELPGRRVVQLQR